MSVEEQSKRVFGLDIMRALAIMPVVILHATVFLRNIDTKYPWVHLYEGVDVFFVLSGFLIGTILVKLYSNTPGYNIGTILGFLKRRWFRTFPNYFLVLALNVILVYFGIIDGDIHQFGIRFLFFCQNLFSPLIDFFWESWSLTIEEWFYLLFPFMLFFFLVLLKNKINRKYLFLSATIIFLIVPLLLRIYKGMHTSPDYFAWDVGFKKMILLRLDAIGWGILAAYVKFYHNTIFYKYKFFLFLTGLALYIALFFIPSGLDTMFRKAFMFTLMGIAIMLTVPLFDSIKYSKGVMAKVVTHISKISYSMYLVNLGLVAQVISNQAAPHTKGGAVIMYLVYWAAVIGISTLIYKYYEKPIMDLRDRKIIFGRAMKSGEKN